MGKKENIGKVIRLKSGGFEVIASGCAWPVTGPSITCENPDAPLPERIYHKIFIKKPIYLAGRYQDAVREVLRNGQDVVVLGMNGYSRLTDEQCRAWGVKPGAYEEACAALLHHITKILLEYFSGIDVRYVHGASNLGVDRAAISVARRLNRLHLGHSCPDFMLHVEDDEVPVYVARNQTDYAEKFIKSLDILISANGRAQTFQQDINAAFMMLKHVIPVNILRSISETGGPPAIGPDGQIEDAVAAFEHRVHMMAVQLGFSKNDRWQELVNHVQETTVGICRSLVSPSRAFSKV